MHHSQYGDNHSNLNLIITMQNTVANAEAWHWFQLFILIATPDNGHTTRLPMVWIDSICLQQSLSCHNWNSLSILGSWSTINGEFKWKCQSWFYQNSSETPVKFSTRFSAICQHSVWMQMSGASRRKRTVDLAKGYHLMTYSPTGVEATAVELQDSARTLCRRNCKLYRLRSA